MDLNLINCSCKSFLHYHSSNIAISLKNYIKNILLLIETLNYFFNDVTSSFFRNNAKYFTQTKNQI